MATMTGEVYSLAEEILSDIGSEIRINGVALSLLKLAGINISCSQHHQQPYYVWRHQNIGSSSLAWRPPAGNGNIQQQPSQPFSGGSALSSWRMKSISISRYSQTHERGYSVSVIWPQ